MAQTALIISLFVAATQAQTCGTDPAAPMCDAATETCCKDSPHCTGACTECCVKQSTCILWLGFESQSFACAAA